MEAVSGEKVIFEKAAISDTDRGKEMNFFFFFMFLANIKLRKGVEVSIYFSKLC